MSTTKRKNIGWSLHKLMVKIAVMTVPVSISLWCGWGDSYSAFYIAALIQSVNNLYDSSAFFAGYTKFITIFYVLAFLGALITFVLAIIHFSNKGTIVDTRYFVIGIVIALSIPITHLLVEVYSIIKQERY